MPRVKLGLSGSSNRERPDLSRGFLLYANYRRANQRARARAFAAPRADDPLSSSTSARGFPDTSISDASARGPNKPSRINWRTDAESAPSAARSLPRAFAHSDRREVLYSLFLFLFLSCPPLSLSVYLSHSLSVSFSVV